ncbi:GTPase IMAP family member 8-like isoform X2 [Poecilia latipinna]|uniref:GTPase IMAP family member 8-like isoform X2 n=1 Tax=Poecilia latipinna TaxID=48699 RepID=UPI00072ED0BE|nr:PREDICTED: GTPase IMAP family member 8-like isoform X2 [Poecilia latipinna]
MAASADIYNSAQSHPATELRIVLIGGRYNDLLRGKSSAGNFILGQNVFNTSRRTAQSEARQQEVFSRRVTVVDTPGWRWFWPGEKTPKLDQIEIQNSVHLCPPGPHVFLLVIPVDSHLSQDVKSSLKQHLELFNADGFSHTIVLFTAVAPCSDEEIESIIRTNPVLQWILQQCGDRKHFLNLSNREDRDQVKKLLEKIETLITNNGFRHCSVDRSQGETLRKEMRDLTERASKRFDQVQKQRKKLKLQIEDGKVPPDHLKIVMIGGSFGGKSSTRNHILEKCLMLNVDKKGYRRTTHSEISHGVVEGRWLTVVDSPGWFYVNILQETSEMDKLEIENSVNLCPPGPHAVLLVVPVMINADESYLRSVQEHMSLFREEIWKHTLVLFTYGDWLGVKTVEERIESDEGLQWIVNKCENRYHVLNNKDHSDKTQVKELLEKIEEMWAGNEDPYYEVELDQEAELETKRETGDKMARRLKTINERKTRVLNELIGGERSTVTDIRIILVGQKCSGKSTAANMILFKKCFNLTFETACLKKNFSDQERITCVKHEGNFDGVKVSVVETPGWFSDPTPPDWIKDEVLHSVSMCSPGPHVFLLLVPILRSFTEKDLKALLEIMKPLTERVWRHCMVVFSYGDWINDVPVENYIVREGKELQELLEKCGNRYHVLKNFNSDYSVQVEELFQKIVNMVTQNKECFSVEDKKEKFLSFLRPPKQQILTEQEWKRREQELIEQMMKALEKEPEEPTEPRVRKAWSKDDDNIPDMSGDVASEYGSISEKQRRRGHDQVAEWLNNKVRESEISSGISSICSSITYMENFDESSEIH